MMSQSDEIRKMLDAVDQIEAVKFVSANCWDGWEFCVESKGGERILVGGLTKKDTRRLVAVAGALEAALKALAADVKRRVVEASNLL